MQRLCFEYPWEVWGITSQYGRSEGAKGRVAGSGVGEVTREDSQTSPNLWNTWEPLKLTNVPRDLISVDLGWYSSSNHFSILPRWFQWADMFANHWCGGLILNVMGRHRRFEQRNELMIYILRGSLWFLCGTRKQVRVKSRNRKHQIGGYCNSPGEKERWKWREMAKFVI